MNKQFYQETDSGIIFAFPDFNTENFIKDIEVSSSNTTEGSYLLNQYRTIPDINSIINDAWQKLNYSDNYTLVERAKTILSKIQEMIDAFNQFGFDLGYLPPINTFYPDDESILIEWLFEDFRVGFNIEPIKEESGWYLITNKKLGSISASGFYSDNVFNTIILWLLNFIISNS